MIGSLVNYLVEANYTDLYAILVWVGVLLAVAWTILMAEDPANAGLPPWDLRLRRFGVYVMVAGFLISVLFAGNQGWTPWPPMVLIVAGFDFFLAAVILTARHRAKIESRAARAVFDPSLRDRPFYRGH